MTERQWLGRFARNLALWLIPVAVLWLAITPFYNRFLVEAAENLVRLSESPSVTRLSSDKVHYLAITRVDAPGILYSVRTTDVHFHLVMLGLLFLAVPRIPARRRFENLGWAVLLSAFFHLFLLFAWVKFVYATQLGAWSVEHYPPWKQNFWGLAKHLLDLPFKFALPLILWSAFYLRELLGQRRGGG